MSFLQVATSQPTPVGVCLLQQSMQASPENSLDDMGAPKEVSNHSDPKSFNEKSERDQKYLEQIKKSRRKNTFHKRFQKTKKNKRDTWKCRCGDQKKTSKIMVAHGHADVEFQKKKT